MMRPACFNRPPRAAGRWHQVGTHADGRPVLRWYPRWYVDRCAVHDGGGIGPNGEGYAAAHGWDCGGCRWESGTGDGWWPPTRICTACYCMHAAEHETCLLCGAPLLRDTLTEERFGPSAYAGMARDFERVGYRSARAEHFTHNTGIGRGGT